MTTAVAERVASPALVLQLVREVRQQVAGRGVAPLVIGVRARPDWTHGDLVGDDGPVRVVVGATPLAIREALVEFSAAAGARAGTDTLVVLTDRSEADLGADLLGRFVRPSLRYLSSWKAVCQRLGVRQLDPDYGTSALSWMAEALLTVPPEEVPAGLGTLSVDVGLRLLAGSALGADGITLERLLVASARPGFSDTVVAADPEVLARLCGALAERLGPAGVLVTGAIVGGRGTDALPAGLAAATVTGDDDPGYAHALIQALTGVEHVGDAALVAWARAAERALESLEVEGAANLPELLTAASQLVTDWRAPRPEQSAVLGAGFEARLAALARELDGLLDGTAGVNLASVRQAVALVRAHRSARVQLTRHRAERAELAARLALWLQAPVSDAFGTAAGERPPFGEVLRGYLADGAWVDAARRRVEEGDDSPAELSSTLGRISEAAYERRRVGNERFARALAAWSEHGTAGDLPDGPVVAVESVLAGVAVPLAAAERALLVVLDGCGVAQFLEFAEQFRHLGFTEIGRGGRAAGLAVLPTVTEVSRSSLLCGELSPGNAEHEKRGFTGNDAVARLPGAPALLFHHHQDLGSGVGVGLPPTVLAALGADGPRLVGAVVNTIDDALGRGVFTREYTIENLGPLQGLLRAAADAGRFVVITADHGHVLGVGLDGRGEARRGGEGGDRWRDADRDPDDDEVVLRGPRVLRGGDAGIIAPAQDDLRYSAKHGGYHGGATPEECLVPVAVFAPPGVSVPSGWEPIAVAPPAWWDLAAVAPAAGAPPQPTKKPRRQEQVEGQGDLFPGSGSSDGDGSGACTGGDGSTADPTSSTTPAAPWIDALVGSDTYKVQLGAMSRAKPPEDRVRAALGALHARGGTASFSVIVQATAMPAPRVPGFLSALERLLNVDGYGVIIVDRSAQEVRLDEDLLRAQFFGDGS